MKQLLLLFLSCTLLFSCEQEGSQATERDYVEEYGGKWNVTSRKWRDDIQTFGNDPYVSGYVRFEFTGALEGNIKYFYDYYEMYEYTSHYYTFSQVGKFEIINNRFVMEENIGLGEEAFFRLLEPDKISFNIYDFYYIFEREL